MTDPVATTERQQSRGQGLIASIITFPFRLAGVLIGSLLLAIVIECVGMHVFWSEQRWRHSQSMFEYELDQISVQFTESVVVQEPGRAAHSLVETGYHWIFIKTGLLKWMSTASAKAHAPSQTNARKFQYYLIQFYVWLETYLIAAAFTTLTFIIRLLVLTLTIPLFVMASFVGLVDGLVRRDIRKFEAGRESSFLYHRVKASIVPLAVFPWIIYLTLPVSIHPLFIFLPGAALLGFVMSMTAGSFKKYL